MRELPGGAGDFAVTLENDCWNRIGVLGDGTCAELRQHVHCRNCPRYATAARALLEREVATDYLSDRTRHFAQEAPEQVDLRSVFIFRVGAEWLALPTQIFEEVAELRSIHSLPHRRGGAVLGVANVRGELLVCVSLGRVLGLETGGASTRARQRPASPRLLVIGNGGRRLAFPVEEVHGIHSVHAGELRDVPATVARAAATHSTAVFAWRQHTVGLLDVQGLLHTLHRSLG
jgi:chemotaxis-related protein WspD